MIVVDWNRIRVFAGLPEKLIYDKDRASDYFSPVREYTAEARDNKLYYRTKIRDVYPRIRIVDEPVLSKQEEKHWQYLEGLTPYEYVTLVKSFGEAKGVEMGRQISIMEVRFRLSSEKETVHWDIKADEDTVEYPLPF